MNNKYLGMLVVILLCINDICLAQEISIKDIVSKIESIDSVYYESTQTPSLGVKLSGGDGLEHGKTWFKNGYLRKDIRSESPKDKRIIKLFTPKETYIYYSISDETQKGNALSGISLLSDFKLNDLEKDVSYKIMGTVSIDNEQITVIEHQNSDSSLALHPIFTFEGVKVKSWIINETGVPIKQEIQWQDTKSSYTYTQIIEYKNYSFEDIPDEIFAIPE